MNYEISSITPENILHIQLDAFKALNLSTNPKFIQRCNTATRFLAKLADELNFIDSFPPSTYLTPEIINRKRALALVLKHATTQSCPPTSDLCSYVKLKSALKKLNNTTPCRVPPSPAEEVA